MASRPAYETGATWSSEINTDVNLNVSVGNKHFRIDLFTANFEASPQFLKEYLRHVERSDPTYMPPLQDDPNEDEFVDPLEEFYDWATEPFAALFREISPLDQDGSYTLQACLFPEQFTYTLHMVDDKLVPVPRDVNPESRPVGVLLTPSETLYKILERSPLSLLSKSVDKIPITIYRPTDIYVRLNDSAVALPTNPRKVYMKGDSLCFFKQLLAGDVSTTVTELASYTKIQAAKLGEDVLVSRLHGTVEDGRRSRIVGLLLSYIDSGNRTLSCAA